MKGHVNKRLDSMIHLLMKLKKGKATKRSHKIQERHCASQNLSLSDVSKNNDGWTVKSDINYTIIREHDDCPYNCFIRCQQCRICIHNFSCTCIDFAHHGTICKHIHLISRFIDAKEKPIIQKLKPTSQNSSVLLNSIKDIMGANVKERLLQKLNCIIAFVHQSTDIDCISHLEEQYISPSMNTIKLYQTKSDKIPANKLIEKQQFYSTKRKRKTNIRMGKPSTDEKKKIISTLVNFIPEHELSRYNVKSNSCMWLNFYRYIKNSYFTRSNNQLCQRWVTDHFK